MIWCSLHQFVVFRRLFWLSCNSLNFSSSSILVHLSLTLYYFVHYSISVHLSTNEYKFIYWIWHSGQYAYLNTLTLLTHTHSILELESSLKRQYKTWWISMYKICAIFEEKNITRPQLEFQTISKVFGVALCVCFLPGDVFKTVFQLATNYSCSFLFKF